MLVYGVFVSDGKYYRPLSATLWWQLLSSASSVIRNRRHERRRRRERVQPLIRGEEIVCSLSISRCLRWC